MKFIVSSIFYVLCGISILGFLVGALLGIWLGWFWIQISGTCMISILIFGGIAKMLDD